MVKVADNFSVDCAEVQDSDASTSEAENQNRRREGTMAKLC